MVTYCHSLSGSNYSVIKTICLQIHIVFYAIYSQLNVSKFISHVLGPLCGFYMQLYAIQLIWIFAIFLRLFKLFFLLIVREKPAQARDPSKTPARAFVR